MRTNSIKKIIVGVLLCAGLILVTAEAANGSTLGTFLIKSVGLISLAAVAMLWKVFHLADDPQIKDFVDND